MFPPREPKIGLALGSGAAKGLVHIGVIKALERHGIAIHCIAGASIGAIVGGLYAATKNIEHVEQLALSTNSRAIFSLMDPVFGGGFLGGARFAAFLKDALKNAEFENLAIPFAAVATDMKTGHPVVMRKNDRESDLAPPLSLAIRASASVPLVFRPVVHEGKILADGGLSMPVPVAALRSMGAECIIAVNLDGDYFSEEREKIGMREMAQDIINLLQTHLAYGNILHADVTLAPKVGKVGWKSFMTREGSLEVIALGEAMTLAAMPEIKAAIAKKQKTFWQRVGKLVRV